MPFYHATRRRHLPSILREGLHSEAAQNFECEKGVYLSLDPAIAFGFLLEDFFLKATDESKPSQELKDFIVIVVDDARVNQAQLKPDPNVEGKWQERLFIYEGCIDVTGMPILDADILFPDENRPEQARSQEALL